MILNARFSSKFFARTMQLRSKLANAKKRGSSLNEYFLVIKNIVDALAATGRLISEEDHILQILAGVGQEFDSTVSVIIVTDALPSLQKVYSLLLAQESRNERNHGVTPDGSVPTVNLVSHERSSYGNSSDSFDSQRRGGRFSSFQNGRGNGNHRRNWTNTSKSPSVPTLW